MTSTQQASESIGDNQAQQLSSKQEDGAQNKKTPHVLMILDGFGHREEDKDNAIAAANMPNLDRIYQKYPHGLISASGEDVGLPDGQFGNSEVGHMNLGAGRVLYQDSTRISNELANREFYKNEALVDAVKAANELGGNVHIMGLLSDGGVHSHQDHIEGMCHSALVHGAKNVFIHCFLDGRDTPPKSADKYINRLRDYIDKLNAHYEGGRVQIASIIGRYYAMDRDNRWDRVQKAYELITEGKADRFSTRADGAVQAAYKARETDEFISPTTVIGRDEVPYTVEDNDALIFMNFRADRARELAQAFVLPDHEFSGFARQKQPKLAAFVMLTKYSDVLADNPKTSIAYYPTSLANTLGEYLQDQGKTQLRIAETEKYAHVTFFFSGGREEEYDGETRILVPSPDVATYDLKPEMSAPEVTDKLVEAIESGQYDVLVVNYANGDMVGHTGVFDAAVKAVEALDVCVGRIESAVKAAGGDMLITADHGNCEQMQDYESGQVHTQHTTEHVPLIYVGTQKLQVRRGGKLSDVAPTILALMNVDAPTEMTGESLLVSAS
ncbi:MULTISPECIES: 2,3-bisphosphoglycerate-independent phosphoglycerate mutase [Psychrobacter]|jgi:2,3-bisphosphoglycerate-independent phosphoglycerate mutase|uniref:2,3-bisphosphoglycerate-independent phosphoglycerate mutase n=3 Tax=Psychrobacter TaxID=497 RepID=A0A1G6VKC3_9GAMM|nr:MULTISPECIES: 2,3-bisphosphoglycerate-independent phosphoglycerate mutase [Psychrobacter]MDH4905322.1 2,3-bisphosphoglycerate-independent phosphoglycerate mutase [Psychrobacter pocilloporae]GLR28445.1 2,3-bisphosphoglycerate-independent phosphoglycerate mutase [Psychrobacter pacificensis]SDD53843.1 phosphoglycerate mutase [Psychrobacter pacificensis]|tara:strand:+ start:8503 stop:10167 length:1665 start_codon:yes stop_codon:yes gene_type:complete